MNQHISYCLSESECDCWDWDGLGAFRAPAIVGHVHYNRRSDGGRRLEGGKRQSSLVAFILSHLAQLMCEDSPFPTHFRQTQFHLSSGFMSFTLNRFSAAIAARHVW